MLETGNVLFERLQIVIEVFFFGMKKVEGYNEGTVGNKDEVSNCLKNYEAYSPCGCHFWFIASKVFREFCERM